MLQSSKLVPNKVAEIRNFEFAKNTKHSYNHDYQTVRLVSSFESGSCISSFGRNPKVKTATVFRFGPTQSGNCGRVSSFGPFQLLGLHIILEIAGNTCDHLSSKKSTRFFCKNPIC